jgi:hypothetical protein
MLAYLFWHWPTPGVESARYTEVLVAFHRALAAAPPPGFRGSRVFEIESAPWLSVDRAFEDWYFLDDFTALGVLNYAAISASLQTPHDSAARLAGGGHGGVYRRLAEPKNPPSGWTTWCSKPSGVAYPAFVASLPAAETWQRQLVLGPAPEFCLVGIDAAAALGGRAVATRQLYAPA